jgi:lipopolysaccharide transport system ATP-binding protein
MKPAIEVQGLSKGFRLGAVAGYRTLRESIGAGLRRTWRSLQGRGGLGASERDFWALRDVSFTIRPGEVVGIIGRNGSGKSTLLKVLSRVYEPTSGEAVIRGRLASLLEVGTGFHPELTGRENIYLNGSILGMSRQEIARKFDDIIAFSEIEAFLDTPVKRYSSGMYVRLAFAVAAHLEPEILLVDEVLAVGDLAFQRKCLGKMSDVAREGRTVFFVSHSMPAVEALCTRGLWLQGGRLHVDAPARECVAAYTAQATGDGTGTRVDLSGHPNRKGDGKPVLRAIRTLDGCGQEAALFPMGETLQAELSFASDVPLRGLQAGVGIEDVYGRRLVTFTTAIQPSPTIPESARSGVVSITVENLPLTPGRYFLSPAIASVRGLDLVEQAIAFEVVPRDVFGSGKIPNPSQGCFFHPARFSYVATHEAEPPLRDPPPPARRPSVAGEVETSGA